MSQANDLGAGSEAPISDLREILRSLQPVLNPGVFVYLSLSPDIDLTGLQVLATFRETEGVSVIVDERDAESIGSEPLFRASWITLSVRSDLRAVGLTGVIGSALGNAGISSNIVAAACHDHVFVPVEKTEAAMKVLNDLQAEHG